MPQKGLQHWWGWLCIVAMLVGLCGMPLGAADYMITLMERVRARYSDEAYRNVSKLAELFEHLKGSSELTKVGQINEFVNHHVVFTDDLDLWNSTDYWASPLETLGRGGGDCEDFSIAKYVLLKKLGIAQDKLRMIYVRATLPSGISRAHMVLAYYSRPGVDPLILDNLSAEVLSASRREDLFPVFSFNERGIFLATQPNVRAGASTSISKWRDLLQRMHDDGLD